MRFRHEEGDGCLSDNNNYKSQKIDISLSTKFRVSRSITLFASLNAAKKDIERILFTYYSLIPIYLFLFEFVYVDAFSDNN
jgi:hypothetical protein